MIFSTKNPMSPLSFEMYMTYLWLVGANLPLWKIMEWVSNSWDDYSIPNMMGKSWNPFHASSHHQPAYSWLDTINGGYLMIINHY